MKFQACLLAVRSKSLAFHLPPKNEGDKTYYLACCYRVSQPGGELKLIVNWVLRRIYGCRHVRGSNRRTNPIMFFNFNIIYRLHLQSVHMKLTSCSSTFSQLFINTLRTGDADLRFYITTVQDG